jgi:hypothetical protein
VSISKVVSVTDPKTAQTLSKTDAKNVLISSTKAHQATQLDKLNQQRYMSGKCSVNP